MPRWLVLQVKQLFFSKMIHLNFCFFLPSLRTGEVSTVGVAQHLPTVGMVARVTVGVRPQAQSFLIF